MSERTATLFDFSSLISPIAIPETGAEIGTPPSINASVEPQTDAIEEEPFDDKTSDTILSAYGKFYSLGTTGSNALSAKAPCPISRRPVLLIILASPVA